VIGIFNDFDEKASVAAFDDHRSIKQSLLLCEVLTF